MRAYLARLLVMEPDLLMLDEPTNHLDLISLLWFQRYLVGYPGAILMISHDRHFMDAIVDSVVEIDPDTQELVSYTGNYSSYLEQRGQRYHQKLKAYQNQRKEIENVQEFIDRFRQVASKAAQVQSRIKQLDKLEKLEKPRAPRKAFKFAFPQPERSNQKVVELKNADFAYGNDKVIYQGLDLTIERGDKIVLVGPNGAGKTTLMKILSGQLKLTGGEREAGYLTKLGYYSQHRSETLTESNRVLDEVMDSCPTLREEDARAILGTFLFRRTDVEKRCGVLSGGEKSRLNLVKFLVDPPNLLLMDEPTTHLDILSIDSLVNALKDYQGTLVFISHDVHFIRHLAETTLHITRAEDDSRSVVTRYTGGYDYFLEKSGIADDRSAVTAS
jgi:ATP-binding cassette subfamily F protein 3